MMKRLLIIGVVLMQALAMTAQLVGNPTVDYNVDEVGTDFITITFTPNADAAGYAICLFDAGTAEQQFAMFGAWMGFQTMGDMIKGWGITYNEEAQYTWRNQSPGKDYEIYVQCWDVNGTDADMIIIPVTTQKLGGEGLAEMTIEIGEFGGSEETGYYQWVTYKPNENVSLHRDIIITKAAYESEEWGEENLLNYLKQDNPYNPYWDQYGVDEAQWNAEPNTWYIAFSIAKNALDEWGPLASYDFVTPSISTSVNELSATGANFRFDGNQINAKGAKAGGELSIYDISGRLMTATRASASGEAVLDLSGLTPGIYIITDGVTTFKFIK